MPVLSNTLHAFTASDKDCLYAGPNIIFLSILSFTESLQAVVVALLHAEVVKSVVSLLAQVCWCAAICLSRMLLYGN